MLIVDDNLDLGASNLVINGVESVDITGSGDNTLTLTMQDVLDVTDSNNQLLIDGNAGDTVISSETWSQGSDMVIDSVTYHVFSNISATIIVNQDIDTAGLVA
jgi:hypothetical protein